MDYDLFDDLDEAIALVEPHEPRAAAVLSARYARFVASPGSPADLADLRDILMTLSGIIRRYHVVDRGVTTDQLVTGLRDLVEALEKTFDTPPVSKGLRLENGRGAAVGTRFQPAVGSIVCKSPAQGGQ